MRLFRALLLYGASSAQAATNLATCCDVDPATVDATTRADWCREQMTTRPQLCSSGTSQNSCDPVRVSSHRPAITDRPEQAGIRVHMQLRVEAEYYRLFPNTALRDVPAMEGAMIDANPNNLTAQVQCSS